LIQATNLRAIPSMMDGLKPGQRKILYCCFKRNLIAREIKVASLAGYVIDQAAYHHGEAALCGTVVAMAQNYVGGFCSCT
jgi:DNA topoisomerase-2